MGGEGLPVMESSQPSSDQKLKSARLNDSGVWRAVLCVDGQSAWAVPAADGLTPFQLAQKAGTAEGVQANISAAMAKRHAALVASQDAAKAVASDETNVSSFSFVVQLHWTS
jgi:hypothetical protein